MVLAPSQAQQLIKSCELFHILAQNTRDDLVMAKWPYSNPKKDQSFGPRIFFSIPVRDLQRAAETQLCKSLRARITFQTKHWKTWFCFTSRSLILLAYNFIKCHSGFW